MTGELVLALRVLAAACLYGFLAWAVLTLWRDLRSQLESAGGTKIPVIQLTWEIDGQNMVKEYSRARISLGRDPSSDFPLKDGTVSAHHAFLSYHHKQWWLEDLKSTNGTFLNDEKLDTPTVIVSGDEIRCGQVPLRVEIRSQDGKIQAGH